MRHNDETQADTGPGALNRRNAIKAAAALGVGAAAWSGPQIGIFGQTPAYAAACSDLGSATATGIATKNGGTGPGGCSGNTYQLADLAFGQLDAGNGLRDVTVSTLCTSGITIALVQDVGDPPARCRATVTVTGTPTNYSSSASGGASVFIPQFTVNNVPGKPDSAVYSVVFVCTDDPNQSCEF